jgi:LAO/AO transport system kinase
MWERIEAGLRFAFKSHPAVRNQLPQVLNQVAIGQLAASTAARQLLANVTTTWPSASEPAP